MSVRILLARHGETEWNATGRRQGQLDSALTTLGKSHADEIASALEGEPFDMICSSPLGRAMDTAAVVADRYSMEVAVFDQLAELDHGRFAGLTDDEINKQFPGAIDRRNREKYTWRFPDGESYADLDRRSATALQAIERAGSNAPLIVSHAMITRMLLRNLLDLDPTEALKFNLPHGVVLEVQPGSEPQTRWLSH